MARKPVKKRKTTARKKSHLKVIPKAWREPAKHPPKPKPLNPKFKLKIGIPEDPFFIHPETIPDGVALQWVTSSVMGTPQGDLPYAAYSFVEEAIKGGWKLVEGQKPLGGLVLMWAAQEVAKAQTQVNIDRAKQMMAEARALFGMDGHGASQYHGHHLAVRIAGPEFLEARPYGTIPSDAEPVDVDITIKFRVSARWQDAAACLGLDVQEYARRRLIMEDIVLAAYGYRDDRVYEPVELSITRKD